MMALKYSTLLASWFVLLKAWGMFWSRLSVLQLDLDPLDPKYYFSTETLQLNSHLSIDGYISLKYFTHYAFPQTISFTFVANNESPFYSIPQSNLYYLIFAFMNFALSRQFRQQQIARNSHSPRSRSFCASPHRFAYRQNNAESL